MSNSITYTFSSPADSSITVTIGSAPGPVTAADGQSYQGYAVTGISGTFNGDTITGLLGPGGMTGSDASAGSYDNTIFVDNTQGDGGSSFDGLDDEGLGFTTASGAHYGVFYYNGAFQYESVGNVSPAVLASTNEPNTVCFAAGTLIRTPSGDRPIETLAVGDLVETASGAARPITWLGHRRVDCTRYADPADARPVRIAAGAFGERRPARDLLLSPGHGICVDLLGEVLIPAIVLVNGATITQDEVDSVTYWHLELETQDIVLAENLPSESYLDVGNRAFFGRDGLVVLDALPDAPSLDRSEPGFCRPSASVGPLVEAARLQLRRRAVALGWTIDEAPASDLHLLVDGVRLDPAVQGRTACFMVPAGACEIALVSGAARPRDVGTGSDARRLGACIGAISIEDGFIATRRIALDDPRLVAGFHDIEEGCRRWTDGRAVLAAGLWEDCGHGFILRIDLAQPSVPRWMMPGGEPAAAVQTAA